MFLLIATGNFCMGQAIEYPANSQPASSNIRGVQYPRVTTDLRAIFRIKAPDADLKTVYNGLFTDVNAFNKKVNLVWVEIGTAEPENMYKNVNGFHQSLTKIGVKHVYYESPGTAHEWQTWRRSLNEFAPLLFK